MYGSPAGVQIDAGQWQHDALREASAHRRNKVDSDFDHDYKKARELHNRLVVMAGIIVLALSALVLI
jgi:hypothetical protein